MVYYLESSINQALTLCWIQMQMDGDYKGNNKITELRTILQRESQNS